MHVPSYTCMYRYSMRVTRFSIYRRPPLPFLRLEFLEQKFSLSLYNSLSLFKFLSLLQAFAFTFLTKPLHFLAEVPLSLVWAIEGVFVLICCLELVLFFKRYKALLLHLIYLLFFLLFFLCIWVVQTLYFWAETWVLRPIKVEEWFTLLFTLLSRPLPLCFPPLHYLFLSF